MGLVGRGYHSSKGSKSRGVSVRYRGGSECISGVGAAVRRKLRLAEIRCGRSWLIRISAVAATCFGWHGRGWVFHAVNKGTLSLSEAMGNRPVAKAVLAGIILAVCGMALPFTMFAGESQAHYLMEGYSAIPAVALIATGFVKCALTPTCLNLGWHGGHFFPVIFSGVSLGYGFALLTGAAPAFCVAACTSALMGAVMRQPIMAALLLMLCFPLKGVVVMLVAAVIGAAIPLPKVIQSERADDRA